MCGAGLAAARRHPIVPTRFAAWIMKPDKHFVSAAGILLAAAVLIALTWIATMEAIRAERADNTDRVTATLTNQALTFTEQINRQILTLDQTLRILVAAWAANPRGFDLSAWLNLATALNGLSRDMVLTDANGIIRQSSVNEAINQNASGLDYFRALVNPSVSGDAVYIGPPAIDGIMRQWHLNVARALHYPDGSFAGAIDTDYRVAAITDVFGETDLGPGSFVTLVGLDDGRLRGSVGPASVDPGASISDTPMYAAIRDAANGVWTGPSPSDAVQRIHAFRHIPGRNLAVVVAMSETEAMRPAMVWRRDAETFAGFITALLTVLALALIRGTNLARRRAALAAEDRAVLASTNAQWEVARALASAKAEQLEATLSSIHDGMSMFDGHVCLVEWNGRFPEVAGFPAEILRVGLPMEEILRAQIAAGQFGRITDPEAEVERRMARLRVAPYGVVQRLRPDGHTIELRRSRLPDGGFVTLYTDITEHRHAEESLRQAKEAAELANTEKSRFVAIVSHEIRTPLNALLNTMRLLSDSVLAPAQKSLLAMAHQSGDVLFGLISDILDMSQMEAGKLSIRPSLFELRPLLDSCVEMFATQAANRGITIRVAFAEGTPETLLTDPGRLRQVQLNLLSNAVKYARPGVVWLTVEPGHDVREAIRLTVKDEGPAIAPEARKHLFRPFSRLERPGGDDPAGTGLGLSICLQLMTLMGGKIGCDTWRSENGWDGNAFWITLPAAAVPLRSVSGMDRTTATIQALADQASIPRTDPAAGIAALPRRSPPRTRVLLAEDVVANQRVIATLLRRGGHHVDIAANGPAVIHTLRVTPYDLLFMDIFMPGMSGQEATRIIRTLPEPACSIPIIALTANTGSGDETVFKAAGMDGIVGKPVSLAELLDVLDQHVWSAHAAAAASASMTEDADRTASSMPKRSNTVPVLAFDRIDELRTNLPPGTFANLVEECLVDMEHRLPALRRALVARAPGAVTAHAHALVGMAAGYGMAALEARLRAVMTAARDGDLTTLGPAIVTTLEADFIDAARTLREMLGREAV
jgi:signal transduction histidine kinase/CheY-like chemotaxis protein